MKNKLLSIITTLVLLSFSKMNFGQAPGLGTASGFALYNVVEALDNVESTYIKDIGTNANMAPLLIGMLSFNANCDNQNIVLKWTTATETNNDYYSIERSKDGINWQIAGTVNGAGNSNTMRNYSFTDTEPYNDISYYRLKQTDFDGKFKYFNMTAVKNCRENLVELDVYPNPANGMLNLFLKGDIDQIHSISIYNVLGKKIYNSEIYQSTIDLLDKPDGIYFIHFNLTSEIVIKKLVIEKQK